jgi:signal peptidase I
MDTFTNFFIQIQSTLGTPVLVVFALVAFIGLVAQWALYSKCDLPGIACLVPIWNVVVFLKIMGRPWHHMFFLLIPGYNIYFIIRVYIELCQSFGKTSTIDYVMIILLNGLYILNLGLSYEAKYKGPVYKGAGALAEPQLA